MTPVSLLNLFLNYADQLKFRNLFLIVIILFGIDILIPDFIPLIDEIILGLLAVILANWKKERRLENGKEGNVIEGEVVDEDKN